MVADAGISGSFQLTAGGTVPVLSFVGDSNTGMWSSVADTINLGTAGFSRLSIAPSGNITMTRDVSVGEDLTVVGVITGGSITGDIDAADLTSGLVPSARISGTYNSLTGTGALNAGSITSGFGSINIGSDTITSGAITSNSTITAAGNFVSSTTNAFLSNDGTGNIYLRPQGILNATNQLRINNNGNHMLEGNFDVSGSITGDIAATELTGTIPSARLSGTYSGVTALGTLVNLNVDFLNLNVSDITQNNSNASFIRMSGGMTAATGANITLYGPTHATQPGYMQIDANNLTLRSPTTSEVFYTFTATELQLASGVAVDFAGSGAARGL